MLLLSCRCSYEFVTAVVVFAAVVLFVAFVVVVAVAAAVSMDSFYSWSLPFPPYGPARTYCCFGTSLYVVLLLLLLLLLLLYRIPQFRFDSIQFILVSQILCLSL